MIPSKTEKLAFREVEGCVIILSPLTGKVHELNVVGSFLWNRCDGKTTLTELTQKVLEHFNETPQETTSDIKEFFKQLETEKLISWKLHHAHS